MTLPPTGFYNIVALLPAEQTPSRWRRPCKEKRGEEGHLRSLAVWPEVAVIWRDLGHRGNHWREERESIRESPHMMDGAKGMLDSQLELPSRLQAQNCTSATQLRSGIRNSPYRCLQTPLSTRHTLSTCCGSNRAQCEPPGHAAGQP